MRHSIKFLFSELVCILLLIYPYSLFSAAHPGNGSAGARALKSQISTGNLVQAKKSKTSNARVEPGVILVKFKDSMALGKSAFRTPIASINKLLAKHQVYQIKQTFSFLQSSHKRGSDNLLKIYSFRYSSQEDPFAVARDFEKNTHVEYAEPNYIDKLSETPNDSLYSQQSHLPFVGLPAAWGLAKGEAGNVIIAIVDGGTDWQHEDLQANIWVNPKEIPGNGIDDDNNGFVDDIHGWNFANSTNNPKGLSSQPINSEHGTHTAGIASAVTNNKIGVAGASWNSTLMPINAASARSDTSIGFGYQGIAYAADNGADIISCSWGGKHNPSKLQQEVIDFAFANGALVVAAAGNDGTNNDKDPHFPSNYNHVLAVGSINVVSKKSYFSNFGIKVDVFAPGESILSTAPNNQYRRMSGTSMSTPLVAGIAALVKTMHPEFTVDQLREQIRVTAESLDDRNPQHAGEMGKGKIRALEALTVQGLPAVRVVSISFEDAGGNGQIEPGEEVKLKVKFTNYLATASNLNFNLSTDDILVHITNGSATLPTLNSNDTVEVNFLFNVKDNLREGQILIFDVDIQADHYTDRDVISLITNPPQVMNHNTGPLQTSITSQGNIGYTGFAEESPGVGFVFKNSNYLFEGGLMIGTGTQTVSDCIRGADGETQDDDFRPISLLSITSPGDLADEEGEIVLVDSFATQPLGLEIGQKSYAYTTEPFTDFIIFKYRIKNLSSTALNDLYVGLFFDWDINADAQDYARFDARRNMGYALNAINNPTQIAATRVLTSPGATSYRSINNPADIYGGTAGNGFTDREKWNFLSKGIQTTTLDTTDVSTLTSTGPFTIEPGQSVEVAFAVIGANSQEELIKNAELAQMLWDNKLVPVLDTRAAQTTTTVFQNPAETKYADIIVIADRTLQQPPTVDVWVGSDTTSVAMAQIENGIEAYKGSFEFSQAGTYSIRTRSRALVNGVDTSQTRSFAVIQAKPGKVTTIATVNQKARLQIPARAIQQETYFLADYLKKHDQEIYRFGPRRKFSTAMNLEIEYDPVLYPHPEKLFIFFKDGQNWQRLPSQVFAKQHRVRARVETLGEFKIKTDEGFAGSNVVPAQYTLKQNYPNPFNPATHIEYDLPEDTKVVLKVYNAIGQLVKTLVNNRQLAGSHRMVWNGTDTSGRKVPSGIYFYQLSSQHFTQTRKMILLR